MRKPSRPKWARNMTAKEWKALQACQSTKTPLLRNLKTDLEYQESKGMRPCPDCLAAWNASQRAE